MKLLILTQKVDIDDDVLGFFHGWIKEFARHCEKVTVICLQKGEYELQGNVKVLSLGKEKFEIRNLKLEIWKWLYGHIVKLLYCWRFYKYIWQERKNYDTVFVHMNPEYVVLGGLLLRLLGKKIGLWYTHKEINLKLKIAEKLIDVIFTASKESFCLPSKKVKVTGHGVDVNRFQISDFRRQILNEKFNIIYVGRISKIKNQELLIRAVDIIRRDKALPCPRVDLIGSAIYERDEKYLKKLKNLVKEMKLEDVVNFAGSAPNKEIVKYYQKADLSINLCPTGGMDKAVLESMACGVPVIVYNKTFIGIFGYYNKELILNEANDRELAVKIKKIIEWSPKKRSGVGRELWQIVAREHSLGSLIKNIIDYYNTQ